MTRGEGKIIGFLQTVSVCRFLAVSYCSKSFSSSSGVYKSLIHKYFKM